MSHATVEMPSCVATRFSSRSGGLSFSPSTRPGKRRKHICTASRRRLWSAGCCRTKRRSACVSVYLRINSPSSCGKASNCTRSDEVRISRRGTRGGPQSSNCAVPFNFVGDPFAHRKDHLFACFGRLKPDVSVAAAETDLRTIHDNLLSQYPGLNIGYGLQIVPLLGFMLEYYSMTIWLLAAAVTVLLVVSCL